MSGILLKEQALKRLANNTTAEGIAILDANGTQITDFTGTGGGLGNTATHTVVGSATSTVTLSAEDLTIKTVTIFNNSTANLFWRKGAGATTSLFTAILSPNTGFEIDDYNGIITGVWASVNGDCQTTKITP